jgi:hypothetical protein
MKRPKLILTVFSAYCDMMVMMSVMIFVGIHGLSS